MKAKEYVAQFKAAGSTTRAAYDVAVAMIIECKTIMETRKARSNSALIAILREVNQKWESFTRQCGPLTGGGTVDPAGFKKVMEREMPDVYHAWVADQVAQRERRCRHY